MIHACTIKRSITITGKDVFGRNASITFAPIEKPGWWWKFGEQVDGSDVLLPITQNMIQVKKRRSCFCLNENTLLNVVEHITVLRMCGLDRIVISSDTPWPPYFTSKELIEKLSPMRLLGYNLTWTSVISHGFFMSGNRSSTIIKLEKGVFIDAMIEYKNVGSIKKMFNIACAYDVVNIIEIGAKTQGWPQWYYHVAQIAQKYMQWPHVDRVAWVQKYTHDKKILLALWLNHRILDILGMIGAMSLTDSDIISCKFLSTRGGHKTDFKAFQQIFRL